MTDSNLGLSEIAPGVYVITGISDRFQFFLSLRSWSRKSDVNFSQLLDQKENDSFLYVSMQGWSASQWLDGPIMGSGPFHFPMGFPFILLNYPLSKNNTLDLSQFPLMNSTIQDRIQSLQLSLQSFFDFPNHYVMVLENIRGDRAAEVITLILLRKAFPTASFYLKNFDFDDDDSFLSPAFIRLGQNLGFYVGRMKPPTGWKCQRVEIENWMKMTKMTLWAKKMLVELNQRSSIVPKRLLSRILS